MLDSQGLLNAQVFEITSSVLDRSWAELSAAGNMGYEAFVVWAGYVVVPKRFRFDMAIVPRQTSLMTHEGALVTVDGLSMFESNRLAFEHGRVIAGQIHSHPSNAFHSETDERFPLATLLGAVSVVVEDFASSESVDCYAWAWYRLIAAGRWVSVDPQDLVEVVL